MSSFAYAEAYALKYPFQAPPSMLKQLNAKNLLICRCSFFIISKFNLRLGDDFAD